MNAPATDYARTPPVPGTTRKGPGIAFAALGALAAAAVCFPFLVLALVAPRFVEIFRDFGVALPAASAIQIRVGIALASPLGMGALALAAIAIAVTVGFAFRLNRALGLTLLCLCCAWFAASIGIVVVGMMLPLEAMIQSLQKGGAA